MNTKRILLVVLCFLLVWGFSLGSFAYAQDDINVGAQDDLNEEQAGEYLKQVGLYRGYEDGTLGLDRNITRAEFATLAVRIEGLEDLQGEHKGETIFKDMSASHWASGYVNIAEAKGLVEGFEDRTFRPEEEITYVQALAVVVRILGYDKDVVGEWPDNYIDMGESLGLGRYIDLSANEPINRGEIAVLIYNALGVTVKSGE